MLGAGSGPVTTNGLDPESSIECFDSKSPVVSAFGAVKGSGAGMEGCSLSGSSISSSSAFFLDFFSFLAFFGLPLGFSSSITSCGSSVEDDPEPRISSIEMPLAAVTAAPGLLSPQPSQNLRKSSFIAPHEGHFHVFSVFVDDMAELSIEGSTSSEEDFQCRSFMGEIGA